MLFRLIHICRLRMDIYRCLRYGTPSRLLAIKKILGRLRNKKRLRKPGRGALPGQVPAASEYVTKL